MKCYLLLFSTFLGYFSFSQSSEFRYKDFIFPGATSSLDVVYGSAPKWTIPYSNTDLKMDIYQPQGDTLSKRPLVIFAHAGGFLNGDKQVDDMVALCDSFARKGYVTATINYRMGFNPLDGESAERAVYRGIQDGKAAIRYFKQNYQQYHIDTNNVFFGGMSAGGFMALHIGYMDQESERPASSYGGGTVNNLGCLDCAGNDYMVTSKVKGILSYWGAMQDTSMITSNGTSALLIHGVNDPTVPFTYGHAFGLGTLPATYGSFYVDQRMTHQGIYHEFYNSHSSLHMLDGSDNGTFPSTGPNAFWYDTLLPKTTAFLYKMIKPNPTKISNSNLVVCENEFFPIQVQSDGGIQNQWLTNSIDVQVFNQSAEGTFKITQAGSYQIGYVETNAILAQSDTLWFSVTVTPSPEVSLTASNQEICKGKSVQLTASGASTYTWNQNLLMGSTQNVTPQETTLYQVVGKDTNGCTDTATVEITVQECAGIENESEATIRVFPNPTNDFIYLDQLPTVEPIAIFLSDVRGKIIQKMNISGVSSAQMKLHTIESGMYLLHVKTPQKERIYPIIVTD